MEAPQQQEAPEAPQQEVPQHREWITRTELSERTQIPRQTLAQWACSGKGPRYARFGRHVRYRLSDVILWETEQFVRD